MKTQLTRVAVMMLGGFTLIAASGCQGAEENTLVGFLSDFVRNALAAFLF